MNFFFKIGISLFFTGWINMLHCQYIFNHFNEDKGLPSNSVSSLIKDNKGFIWLGTQNGLCRFDGNEIVAFSYKPSDSNSLCNNNVKTVMQDHEGMIWVGTRKGIGKLNPETKRFTNYSHNPVDSGSISKDVIQFVFEDKGWDIMLSPDASGIDRLDRATGKFTNYLPSKQSEVQPARFVNTLLCHLQDPNDSLVIWFGCQLGLLKFNVKTKSWQHIVLTKNNTDHPDLFSTKENVVRDLLMDDQGKLWLATWGGGLCHLDPETGKFSVYRFEPQEPVNGFRNNITKLHWKSEHELWIVAQYKGVAVFNTITCEFTFITDPANGDIFNMNPSDIMVDDNGFLWISSFSNGLYFTNLLAHQFNKNNLPYNLFTISPDNKTNEVLYAGTLSSYGKLLKIDLANNNLPVYSYSPKTDLAENHFAKIITGKDRIWLLENYDLYWWDEKQETIRLYADFDPRKFQDFEHTDIPYFISGCESASGELWLGTKFNGIFRLDLRHKKYLNYYFPTDSAGNIYFQNFIFTLFPDSKGRIWYGTTEFGYFDENLQRFVNLSFARDFPDAPVKSAIIRSIVETPNGHIWLGTENNGIMVINPDATQSFVGSYTMDNGLAGSWVRDMIVDENGDVWALSEKGLNHIIPSLGKVEIFDEKYGLAGLNRLAKTNSGQLFISSSGGFYHFYPKKVSLLQQSIIPYFKTFRIFDKIVDIGNPLRFNLPVNLKPEENFFSIEYGAINFFNPQLTVFSYKLDGLDEHWISAETRKFVGYTNLPGGNYTFRLRASDGSDYYSEITIPLFIRTPFWKTLWFYIILIVILLAIIFSFYQYRMKQVRKQEEIKSNFNKMISQLEMKALRAQMNPHFLFNSLNSIRYYILKEQFDNASAYLTKFSKLLRLILRNSRENMITLTQELETLNIYIEFEQMRFNKHFEYIQNVDSSVDLSGTMIQPMTIQPFVENAIWHGLKPKEKDRLLTLSISKEGKMLNIVIEDNGIGRQNSKAMKDEGFMHETKSYGLQITKERFAILRNIRGKRSEFEIKDLFDNDNEPSGTRVTIYYEI